MSEVRMVLTNLSSRPLEYSGHRGDELRAGKDLRVEPRGAGEIAVFDSGGRRWGWVYLRDDRGVEYQLYIEQKSSGTLYFFFGYRNNSSTEKDSNPSPFAEGCELSYWDGGGAALYALLEDPRPKS